MSGNGIELEDKPWETSPYSGSDEEEAKTNEEEEGQRCFKSHFLLIVLKSTSNVNLRSAP